MLIERLNADNEPAFAAVLAIYRDAIDPSEQKTEAALRAMLAGKESLFLIARERGVVTGFAILWLPVDEAFWLLEYMAVAPARRGAGLGADLLRASMAEAARPFAIVEAEQPAPGASGELQKARRLRFYARHGFRRLAGLDYDLPLRAAGLPPPMWLLVHADEEVLGLGREGVRAWLGAIYAGVYQQAPDDPRIPRMLAGVNEIVAFDPITLG
jgi:GNAT superfamily N-acetyltransferase